MIPKFNIKLTALCLAMILSNHITIPATSAIAPLRPIDRQLLQAVLFEDTQHVAAALEQGANVNATNVSQETSLHSASLYNKPEMAELLILAGANVNAKNEDNVTPLHKAVLGNNQEIANLLINSGADINARDKNNNTPLIQAVLDRLYYMAELLLLSGADIYAKNKDNKSVFAILEKRKTEKDNPYKEKDAELLDFLNEYQPFTPQGLEEDSLFKSTLQTAVDNYYENQPEFIKKIITTSNVNVQAKLQKLLKPDLLLKLYKQFNKPKYFELRQEELYTPEDLELLEEYQRENIEKAEAADYKRLMEK